MAFILSRSISRPIRWLTSMAENIASGDLNERVTVNSNDEIGQLGTTFNFMTGKLQKSQYQLEKSD